MSNCSNCYTGCNEIVSDKCVKYTGIDVPVLEIQKGDSLSYVEQALITFLTATLNGSGITISLDEDVYCEVVSQYLQECSTVTALDLFKALVKAACNIQVQIDTINETLTTLNADYDVDCLEGVPSSSDTHDVLQAVITKLCELDTSLASLALDLDTNYVKLSDLDSLIQAYLDSQEVTNKAYTKMIPYAPIPYYGSLSNYPNTGDSFDGSGAGLNYWEKVYLCNGDNGTPDLRGRAPIGATSTPGLIPMSSTVNPAILGNPTYTIGALNGANTVTLDETQIPSHTHTASVTDPGHTHSYTRPTADGSATGNEDSHPDGPLTSANTGNSTTGISVENSETGGGLSHANVQPGLGLYFIIYIPS